MKNNKKEYFSEDDLTKQSHYKHLKRNSHMLLALYLYHYSYFNAKRKIKSLKKKNKSISYNKTFLKHFFFMPVVYMALFLTFLIALKNDFSYLVIPLNFFIFVIYWAKKKTNNDILTLERIKKWKIDRAEDKDKAIKEFTSKENIDSSVEDYFYISERIEDIKNIKKTTNPFVFTFLDKNISILLLMNFVLFFILRSIETGISDGFSESLLFVLYISMPIFFVRIFLGFAIKSKSEYDHEKELNEKYPI
ncbi:MAG: hypothetical protein CL760_05040 [Chloroflexi bacterium]|nr:hypothetical protein [Chloroflexota bacterium]|tara:strand:+ start:65 stop:811 length:747 start_codon:yes stop_codon:yes gene_type:complete